MTIEEALATLDLTSLPVTVTVTQKDLGDIFGELATDVGLQQAMGLAVHLRATLVGMGVAPENAICALGFCIGLISKHDFRDTTQMALVGAAAPIVFGNLNTKTTATN